jgi:hypothetical protein
MKLSRCFAGHDNLKTFFPESEDLIQPDISEKVGVGPQDYDIILNYDI